jgi:hypothetical protein
MKRMGGRFGVGFWWFEEVGDVGFGGLRYCG